jgi:hypothetical protein
VGWLKGKDKRITFPLHMHGKKKQQRALGQ